MTDRRMRAQPIGTPIPFNPKRVHRRKNNPYASILGRMKDRGVILHGGYVSTASIINGSVSLNDGDTTLTDVPFVGTPPVLGTHIWAIRQGSSVFALGGAAQSYYTEFHLSSGTWTKANFPSLKGLIVEVVGGGGGGGGAAATAVGQSAGGQGGGAGGWAYAWIPIGSLGTTETITVGAGGAGVDGANGNNGGVSSFGNGPFHVAANGGTGGDFDVASSSDGVRRVNGQGGTATAGDAGLRGGYGFPGLRVGGNGIGGNGGAAPIYGSSVAMTFSNQNGLDGLGWGGGGSGGNNSSNQANAVAGGDGANGVVIIRYVY